MGDRKQPAGPLAGLKAVELAVWVAGPCAAAYLGDLGVEVIKIESLEGDPYRGLPMGPKKELAPGEVTAPEGKSGCVSLPFDFSDTPWRGQSIHPQHGQHTEEVLLEMGRSWEDIAQLKDQGVIP